MLSLVLFAATPANAIEVCPDSVVGFEERECIEYTPYEETCVYTVSVQRRVPVTEHGFTFCATTSPQTSICYAEYGECPTELPSDLPDLCHPDPTSSPDDPCPDIVQTSMGSGLGHSAVEGCCVDLVMAARHMSLETGECVVSGTYTIADVGFYPGECQGEESPDFPDIPDIGTPGSTQGAGG